jgi:hypothetical protein
MRISLLLAVLLLARGARAEPGPLRIAVVHEGELLPSEAKALAAVEKRLGKKRPVTVADAGAAEVAFASGPSGAAPAEWQAVETVILLHVRPPGGDKGKRLSRGVGSVFVFRPPHAEPVYAERVDGEVETPMRAEVLEPWLSAIAALATRAGSAP